MDTYLVEVFAHRAMGGKPLAVVVGDGDPADHAMQTLARAAGCAEAAFVTRPATGQSPGAQDAHPVRVLWSGREIPYSGCAALGAAWVMREHLDPEPSRLERLREVRLEMLLGDVRVGFEADESGGQVAWLAAPTIELGSTWPAAEVYRVLGLRGVSAAGLPPVQLTSAGLAILIVPVPGLQALGACALDGPAFRSFAVRMVRHKALHAVVYAFCHEARERGHHIAARLFLPGQDEGEDPASGAAAACLGAYLLRHERLTPEQGELRIEQGYEMGRPCLLRLRAQVTGGVPTIGVGGAVRLAGGVRRRDLAVADSHYRGKEHAGRLGRRRRRSARPCFRSICSLPTECGQTAADRPGFRTHVRLPGHGVRLAEQLVCR